MGVKAACEGKYFIDLERVGSNTHTKGRRHTHKDFWFWFLKVQRLVFVLICSNWLRRKVFITYLKLKWSFLDECSYHISRWVLHFEDNLFVRSGDYKLTNTWRSYIIVLSDYCQEIAISLYVKYTFEVKFSTRYKTQGWVVLLQYQVGYSLFSSSVIIT